MGSGRNLNCPEWATTEMITAVARDMRKPAAEVQPFVVAAVGERKAALMTTPPDGRAGNGKKAAVGGDETHTQCENQPTVADRSEQVHKAILRAPSEVQRLYCDGVIGQVDAGAENALVQGDSSASCPTQKTPSSTSVQPNATRRAAIVSWLRSSAASRSRSSRSVGA